MAAITRPMVTKLARQKDMAGENRRLVGARIKEERLRAGLTQLHLSKLLDVGETTVSALEGGRISVSPQLYSDLVDIFNLDRKEWGSFLLRHTNPWLYLLIFGEEEGDGKKLAKELKMASKAERNARIRGFSPS